MIKCPVCQEMHVLNTIFCKNCGMYLLKDYTLRTDDLEVNEDQFRTSRMRGKGTNELVDRSTANGPSKQMVDIMGEFQADNSCGPCTDYYPLENWCT